MPSSGESIDLVPWYGVGYVQSGGLVYYLLQKQSSMSRGTPIYRRYNVAIEAVSLVGLVCMGLWYRGMNE